MIMARPLLEMLFIILMVRYSSCKNFTSSPGTVKRDPGSKAVVTWTLSRLFNPKTYLAAVYVHRNNIKIITYQYPHTPCDTEGDSRLDCILPKTTGFIVGFSITSVRDTDAGNYSIEVVHDVDANLIRNENGFVYVFKTPGVQVSGNHETTEGDKITLKCRATSQSLPVSLRYTAKMLYTWNINNPEGNHVVNGNQVTIQTSNKRNQGATFLCVVKEEGSSLTGSDTVILNILYAPGKPQVTDVPTQSLIEDEDILSVACQLSGNDLGNPPVNHYVWRNVNSSYSRDTGSNNKLILSSINAKQHDGIWHCQPENSVGQGQLAQFKVTINAQPSVIQDLPRSSDILNKDSLSVSCSFKAKPAASITWIYEDSNNVPEAITYTESHVDTDRVYTQTTSTLSWNQQVALDDPRRRQAGGRYKCHAVNNVGYRDSGNMALNILFAPYEIHLNVSDLTVTEGEQVAVQCRSECNPTCRFKWTRESDTKWHHNNDILILSAISRQYNDIYTCQAQNVHGTKTANLSITVNFAPEIISFVPSTSGDIIQDNTLNITCEVSSRPKSTITITNINTSDIMLSVNDTHKAVYTFDRVHVLDSGVYQCSAVNGIKPQTDVTRQRTLDIKGGYDLCEKPPTEEGLPLKANVTISFCLSANPFTEITTNNWMFSSKESNNRIHGLPDGVLTSIQDTSHPYKKYVKLIIPAVNKNHFGVYTLKVKNNYNTKEVIHVFNLLPEGPPVPPTELRITYITAVSIYLEWMAGFDGGPDQTFWLYVFDRETFDWFIISNITDTSAGQGGLIEYKLTQEQGVVPDHKYTIHVGAINEISNVTGDSVMPRLKALPYFEGGKPEIVYEADAAEISWPINNIDSVTSILIEVCLPDRSMCNPTVNISSPEMQPYTILLPEEGTKRYVLNFTFYDGNDIVYRQVKQMTRVFLKKQPALPVMIGGILGVLIVAGVVITVIILWRRGYLTKDSRTRRTSQRLESARESSHDNAAFSNPALDEIEDHEINPYGTTSFTRSNTSHQSERANEESIVMDKRGKVGPITGDIYAAVNKPKKQLSSGGEQSSNAEIENIAEEPSTNPSVMPKVSVFPPESSRLSQNNDTSLYAQVRKKTEKPTSNPKVKTNHRNHPRMKKNKEILKDSNAKELTVQANREKPTRYVNVVNKDIQDGTYSEVQLNVKKVCQTDLEPENQYANMEHNNDKRPFQFAAPDIILYADLDIIDKPPADPDVIHGKENLVEYASIDFDKLKRKK